MHLLTETSQNLINDRALVKCECEKGDKVEANNYCENSELGETLLLGILELVLNAKISKFEGIFDFGHSVITRCCNLLTSAKNEQ
jgi:hypothetical protein